VVLLRHTFIVGRQLVRNARAGWEASRGRSPRGARASGAEMSPEQAAAYAEGSFAVLAEEGAVRPGDAVLEVGPGESLALGLRLLAAGAREVVAVDRFETQAELGRRAAIYSAIVDRLGGAEREVAQSAIKPDEDPPLDASRGVSTPSSRSPRCSTSPTSGRLYALSTGFWRRAA
jgi:hypothetical protein